MRSGARVTIGDTTVLKTFDCVEAARSKYEAIHQLGLVHGFHAPAVLACDQATGALTLEKVEGITSLRQHYIGYLRDPSAGDGFLSMVRTAGEALAHIHHGLEADSAADWTASPEFEAAFARYGLAPGALMSGPTRLLHCDYGYSNLFVQDLGSGQSRLVVLDPSPDGSTSMRHWLRGPVHLDIGRMLGCLEGAAVPLMLTSRLAPRAVWRAQDAFLGGYEAIAGTRPDPYVALGWGYALFATQASQRSRVRGYFRRNLRYNSWPRKNFPVARKADQIGHHE